MKIKKKMKARQEERRENVAERNKTWVDSKTTFTSKNQRPRRPILYKYSFKTRTK